MSDSIRRLRANKKVQDHACAGCGGAFNLAEGVYGCADCGGERLAARPSWSQREVDDAALDPDVPWKVPQTVAGEPGDLLSESHPVMPMAGNWGFQKESPGPIASAAATTPRAPDPPSPATGGASFEVAAWPESNARFAGEPRDSGVGVLGETRQLAGC
jgi:hypothetical protein